MSKRVTMNVSVDEAIDFYTDQIQKTLNRIQSELNISKDYLISYNSKNYDYEDLLQLHLYSNNVLKMIKVFNKDVREFDKKTR